MPRTHQDFYRAKERLPMCYSSPGLSWFSPHWEQVFFQDPSCELSLGIKSLHALFIKLGSNTWEKLLGPQLAHSLTPECWPSPDSFNTTGLWKHKTLLPSPPQGCQLSPREGPGPTDWHQPRPRKGAGGGRPRIPWFAWERPILSSMEGLASSQGKAQSLKGWEGKG